MSEVERLRNEYDDLRTNAERWERAVEERDALQIQLDKTREALEIVAQMASAYVSLTGNIRAEERLEKALAAIDAPQLPEGEVGPITEREREA